VVAAPRADGTLTMMPLDESGDVGWQVAQTAALGGVVALRLDATDTTDTFIVGDAAGLLHAWRDGAELTLFDWPKPMDHAVTQAPAAVRWDADGRLGLVVVTEGPNDGASLRHLSFGGNTDREDTLVWPEAHQDSTNGGCVLDGP